jgi:hypothetical protein
MWQRIKGYVILGFICGLLGPFIPGLGGTFLVAILVAFLVKGCYSVYRSDKALRSDTKTLEAGEPPREIVAWKTEWANSPIDQKYRLGWCASIVTLALLLAVLPAKAAGAITAYLCLGAVGLLLVLTFKRSHSRNRFLNVVGQRRAA